jgi:hypothetical protein
MSGAVGDVPLPDVDNPNLAPFWAGTARGELLLKTCRSCGYVQWPPNPRCPECLSAEADWVRSAGAGHVWSVAVYERALDPRFAADIPYAVALVKLDDGPEMIGRVLVTPMAVTIGMRVQPVFTPVADGVTLVNWSPIAT